MGSHFLTITNNAGVNICTQVFGHMLPILLDLLTTLSVYLHAMFS